MAKAKDAFRTISEVAEWLDTPTHVLRFWESKFSQIKPVKGAGGRRYYRPRDMDLLGGIKQLLHHDGLTIKGTQKLLREKGVRYVATLGPSMTMDEPAPTPAPAPKPAPAAAQPAPVAPKPAPPPQDTPAQVSLPFDDPPPPPPAVDLAAHPVPSKRLPDVPGRLIGRAPVRAADLRAQAAAIAPLLTRLATVRARMQD